MTDSTGARLRALIEKLIPWLKHSDGCGALVPPYSYCSCGLNYAYHSALAAVAELHALLLVSESHQRCDCGAALTQCSDCIVADYQAAHTECATCCPALVSESHQQEQLTAERLGHEETLRRLAKVSAQYELLLDTWAECRDLLDAERKKGCQCICHSYPDHSALQDALEALKWHQEKLKETAQLVTESHPSDRLRALIEQLPRWGVRFKQNDLGSYFDGWNQEALGDWVKWSDVEALVRASQPSEGGCEMNGADLIRAERERQMAEEGWSASHDDCHRHGELARAAARYALEGLPVTGRPRWPWSRDWWKPKGRIKNLTRAGALIAAEIDRLQRCEPAPPSLVRPSEDEKHDQSHVDKGIGSPSTGSIAPTNEVI